MSETSSPEFMIDEILDPKYPYSLTKKLGEDLLIHYIAAVDYEDVVTCKNNGVDDVYGIETEVDNDTISKYRNDLYKIENISKPIRAFSYYKLEDLCKICEKLKIPTTITVNDKTKSKSKKMMYEHIVQQM